MSQQRFKLFLSLLALIVTGRQAYAEVTCSEACKAASMSDHDLKTYYSASELPRRFQFALDYLDQTMPAFRSCIARYGSPLAVMDERISGQCSREANAQCVELCEADREPPSWRDEGDNARASERSFTYRALISPNDHASASKKNRFKSASLRIAQDRANYHRFKLRDSLDQDDPLFSDRSKRRWLTKKLTERGAIPADVKRAIESSSSCLIEVEVWADRVKVSLIRSLPPSSN